MSDVVFRNPLSVTAEEFAELTNQEVVIKYHNYKLEGNIKYVQLEANNRGVGSFEFELSPASRKQLGEALQWIPKKFTPREIGGIRLK